MAGHRCRVCGSDFFEEPLVRYADMPERAQHLPSAEALIHDRGVDLEVRQCQGCGLVQLGQEPPPYFREAVRAASVSAGMKAFRKRQFRGFVKQHSLEAKRVIDIGCGGGEYLRLLQRITPDACGLEHNAALVTQCTRAGLKVFQGFVGSSGYDIPEAPFDAFCCLNYLEHLPDPNALLRGIHRNLTPDGVGLVEVPNFGMMLRRSLFYEFMRDHLLYFTRETLATALRVNGFEVLDCRAVWHDYILSARVRKIAKWNLSHLHACEVKLRSDISEFIERMGDSGVAIWGAGHQALMMMALMGLAGRIRYVVDSAPFKQGKYTPVSHIPIVSPETLNSDPVAGIIVMAASYSDEVAGILRRRFKQRLQVAILRDDGLEYSRSQKPLKQT